MRAAKQGFLIMMAFLVICFPLLGCGDSRDSGINRWLFGHSWGETRNESNSKETETVIICGYGLNLDLVWGNNIDYYYTDDVKMNKVCYHLDPAGDSRKTVLESFENVLGEPDCSEVLSYGSELYPSSETSDYHTWYEGSVKYSLFIEDDDIVLFISNDFISP